MDNAASAIVPKLDSEQKLRLLGIRAEWIKDPIQQTINWPPYELTFAELTEVAKRFPWLAHDLDYAVSYQAIALTSEQKFQLLAMRSKWLLAEPMAQSTYLDLLVYKLTFAELKTVIERHPPLIRSPYFPIVIQQYPPQARYELIKLMIAAKIDISSISLETLLPQAQAKELIRYASSKPEHEAHVFCDLPNSALLALREAWNAGFIKEILWQKQGPSYSPSALVLSNGTSLRFNCCNEQPLLKQSHSADESAEEVDVKARQSSSIMLKPNHY